MTHDAQPEDADPDVDESYGPIAELLDALPRPKARRSREFAPWHHPVKQAVRSFQWAEQLEMLAEEGHLLTSGVIRYFTLPGADMMDVRYLARRMQDKLGGSWKMEVVGFDKTSEDLNTGHGEEPEALSILRQDGLVTIGSKLVPGQLESIAHSNSLAADNLNECGEFDVINLDACSHLCHQTKLGEKTIYDALESLLYHQRRRRKPWLLLITTRAQAANFEGQPAAYLKEAIASNIEQGGKTFADALQQALGGDGPLAERVTSAWSGTGELFLKAFTIGLGKRMLHFLNGQQDRAEVRLKSAYCYKVSGDEPDMLALAFRVKPMVLGPLPASNGGSRQIPPTEPELGARIAKRAARMMDVDRELETDKEMLRTAVMEKVALLQAGNYSVSRWLEWLRQHDVRPMECGDIVAAA